VAIETLSDDVLLEIFDLYLAKDENTNPWYGPGSEEKHSYDAWYVLAHVCQRWRYVVFGSPRRLNLRLHCTRRRVGEILGVWPAFPIVIWDTENFTSGEDNIIAALEHRDRVCEIRLERLSILQLEKLVPLMQESFPALTKLQIQSYQEVPDNPNLYEVSVVPVPDSFLGGSAPDLRSLCLESILFPAFPKFLLSASNLVYLYLEGTPFGYISPKMLAALSALSKLEVMHLSFGYPGDGSESDLGDPAPPPLTRSVLPALKILELGGDTEYLDDFVARIDVPSISYVDIVFAYQPSCADSFFHIPQFIGREFRSFNYAGFHLSPHAIDVTLSPQRRKHGSLKLKFLCYTDRPLSRLVEACNTSLLPLSSIENFRISVRYLDPDLQSGLNTEDPQWLEVLRQFSAAKSLYLVSVHIVPPVAFALKQVIKEGMTDVLPAIRELTVSGSLSPGPVREAIEQFATARGLSVLETPGSSNSKWRISARDAHEG
jgi:hypothetical protein